MHNNYYFLRQISNQLKSEIVGFSIGEVYSQAKNELIISLYKGKNEKFIKGHLSPQFCCLSFPENHSRARRNSVNLFPEIINKEITDIVQIDNDRSFYLQFPGHRQLLFKMHGNRSNVILIHQDKVHEVFKSGLKQDYNIEINSLGKSVSIDKNTFENHEGKYKKIVPTLGNSFDNYFRIRNYDQLSEEDKYQCLLILIAYLKSPDFYIHSDLNSLPTLSLYKINENDIKYATSVDALNSFFRKYISAFSLGKEKSNIRNSLNAQLKKIDAYIKKSSQKLEKLHNASNYKHIGDLIMANMHLIKPYESEVELVDFYSQKTVKIPLKSSLSPQLNAEKYYNKSKRQQIEIDVLNANIKKREAIRDNLLKELAEVEQLSSLKQIQKKPISKPTNKDLPYHKVDFMDYEIFVGKNAKTNELLSFQIAKKDDLFLHAKDSPGSHVIIKKMGNQNFPQPVIEKAAAFAAYYSKNKSEALCRVLFTPKKYVRKAKGAPAGAVIVEKEKVVLVRPEKITSQLF